MGPGHRPVARSIPFRILFSALFLRLPVDGSAWEGPVAEKPRAGRFEPRARYAPGLPLGKGTCHAALGISATARHESAHLRHA
jgi:hypothetical protein